MIEWVAILQDGLSCYPNQKIEVDKHECSGRGKY